MDWNALIITLLGGTTFASIVSSIVYYRENKKLKKNEVKNSDTDAQSQQIDLGTKYAKEMLDLIERVEGKMESSEGNQKQMLEKIDEIRSKQDRLDERQDKYEQMQGHILTYLNGDFQKYLARQYGKVQN